MAAKEDRTNMKHFLRWANRRMGHTPPRRFDETRGGPTLRGRALPDSELDVQAIAPGAEALDLIVEALFGDATGGALGGAHGRFQ